MKEHNLTIKVELLNGLHILTIDKDAIVELDLSKIRRGLLNLLTLAMENEEFDAYKNDVSKSICDIEGFFFMLEKV